MLAAVDAEDANEVPLEKFGVDESWMLLEELEIVKSEVELIGDVVKRELNDVNPRVEEDPEG